MTTSDPLRYLSSLAEELASQGKRVRDLIGNRHWLSDGHHKEYLISTLLSRHCPSAILVSRGFVLNPRNPDLCSREQDILLIDTTSEAPLFHQGGLAIASPRSILAAVSVKTSLGKSELCDAFECLNSTRTVALASGVPLTQTFCGAFFFDVSRPVQNSPSIVYSYLEECCSKQSSSQLLVPDYLSSGKDLIYKFTRQDNCAQVHGFSSPGYATAIFLAALLAHVAASRGNNESDILDLAETSSASPLSPPQAQLRLTGFSRVGEADGPPNAKRI
jgi:hypothetical protein